MKKRIFMMPALLLSASMLAACGQSGSVDGTAPASPAAEVSETVSAETGAAESIDPENMAAISVNVEGFGHIAAAQEGETLELDDEHPYASLILNVEKGRQCTIGARPDEGFKFLKWTKNGEDFGTEAVATLTAGEDAEFVAHFAKANPNENITLGELRTVGDLLKNVAEEGLQILGNEYVYVFEIGGKYYRAVAEMPEDVANAYWELDYMDEQFAEKSAELLDPLPITRIEDLSGAAPDEAYLKSLVGKTGRDLLDDGWQFYFYNIEDMEFRAYYQIFDFTLTLDGITPDQEHFEDADIEPLKVVSVEYAGIGDMTNMSYEAPLAEE